MEFLSFPDGGPGAPEDYEQHIGANKSWKRFFSHEMVHIMPLLIINLHELYNNLG